MKLLRRLHLLVLFLLATLIVFTGGALLFLTRNTQNILPNEQVLKPTTEGTHTPTPSSLQTQHTVTLRFDSLVVSTPSATLIHIADSNEALFVPLGESLPTSSESVLFNRAASGKQVLTWDESLVRAWVVGVSESITTHAQLPQISYTPRAQPPFAISPGKAGIGADIEETITHIIHTPTLTLEFDMPHVPVAPPLSKDDIEHGKQRLAKLISHPLVFTASNRTYTITPQDITHLVLLPEGYSANAAKELVTSWAKDFDQQTVEPDLVFDGSKITTFRAPIEGRLMDVDKNTTLVLASLRKLEEIGEASEQSLVVTTQAPKITLASLNSLGITERIGRGDSQYHHSIPNRIKNVALTTTRIHGAIIMPGETFSFNKTLGDVSAATGFLPAYVISQGKTVLGDGGGVCQVSSTLFRALLDAGLPIIERRGHSYRVSYYEENSKPGFDATVSAPHPDLTFLNDTGAPILINAQADSAHVRMYIELYGKKDGRKAEITNYKQWDNTPAPPTLYQDDTTIPKGTLKQIDFAAGGLKTSFDYTVTYPDGTLKHTTYSTTYTPWRAVYLRGV